MRWLLIGIIFLLGRSSVAQKYYLANEGDIAIYFKYKDSTFIAKGEKVDIIFNREKIILWVTVKGSDFKTGKRRIDRRFFRKNENEFVIKAEITNKDVIYGKDEFLQFSLIGRIFNKVESKPVDLMGGFRDNPDGRKEDLPLYMYFIFESKWMGPRFVKHSGYPVVTISLNAILEPFVQDLKAVKKTQKL